MKQMINYMNRKELNLLDPMDLTIEFLRYKKQQSKSLEDGVKTSVWLGIIGGGIATIDLGLTLIAWLLFGDQIRDISNAAGKKTTRMSLSRKANKEVELKNFAGQKVRGKLQDVVALMALQELLLEMSDQETTLKFENRGREYRDHVKHRMNSIIKDVRISTIGSYKILESKAEIKELNIEQHAYDAAHPEKNFLKKVLKKKNGGKNVGY